MNTLFDIQPEIEKSEYNVGLRSSGENHGVVLTKPHIVKLILDLVGYASTENLCNMRILEPACGEGVFLEQIVERLVSAAHKNEIPLEHLSNCIRAFDIDPIHIVASQKRVVAALRKHLVPQSTAQSLAEQWVHEGDFLLSQHATAYDFIVGNPPYVRIEQISSTLINEYRRRYQSLFDRADLYVAFIERSLQLLSNTGKFSFICADRWTSNRYGAPLRKLITNRFSVQAYIDLHRASPFESEVIAYPSIFVMGQGKSSSVPVFFMDAGTAEECDEVLRRLRSPESVNEKETKITQTIYPEWFAGDEPWVFGSQENMTTLRHLENQFALIEDSCKVGIGVATGCDRVYIVDENVDIERNRLVPLVMRDDITNGRITSAVKFVINAFGENGKPINLSDYPKLAKYFDDNSADIRKRHVAKKNPNAWFRTIDRVYPELVTKAKLLIPDIAGANQVVYDSGEYHPHHNLYFITSEVWNMEVLGALLSSKVALFFVWSYAVKMRGGYLRFQAQYLRRIRLPDPEKISPDDSAALKTAFQNRDFKTIDALALKAYQLDTLPKFDFVDTRE